MACHDKNFLEFYMQVFGPILAEPWRSKECVKDLAISCYVPETSVGSNT